MFAIVSMVESCMSEAASLTVIVHLHLSMKHKTSLFCIGPEQNWNKKCLRFPWRKIPWHEVKKHLKSNSSILPIHISLPPFHASTRTKGSSTHFSLHLRNRVSPTQGHALLDEVNTFNCGIFATFVRLPVVVNSAARLGAMAFGKANSGEKWREMFRCCLTFEPPQVVEPLVTIHLYQVNSTDEITQV